MGELFGKWVPAEWRERVIRMARECYWHKFLVLTKAPENIPSHWNTGVPNLWVGVSETCKVPYVSLRRIDDLLNRVLTRRFVSYEPLLGEPDVSLIPDLEWVIVGAQTGPGARKYIPDSPCIARIEHAALSGRTPLFEKGNLRFCMGSDTELIQEYPPGLEV